MEKLQTLVVALCLLLPQVAWGDDLCAPCSGNCGESLGTLSGVDAFSNGARGDCTGTGRGFYQCVEYAKRFHGRSGERWGNANQIFGRAERLDLRSFRNGETEAPRQGDAITFQGGRYGHIAIIYAVGSNFITLIEQNWHNIPGRFRRLDMDVDSGRYTVVSDSRNYTVEGWLRPAADPTITDDDGDTFTESEGDCDDANAGIHPGAAELCNSLDEDCDSEIDETWPLLGDVCAFRPTPLCERTGVWACEPLHRGTVCDGDYEIHVERCNHLDDDCDGETDENWPLLGVACTAGWGECERSNVWVCEPLERGTVCDVDIPFGTPELCDELDNDCDGATDEDWPELRSVCGISPCSGTYVCSLGGSGSYCNVDSEMPEICDGVDNDCDGATDESPAELSCGDGDDCTADSCAAGTCRHRIRDRDHDTYTDGLCGGYDCNDLDPAVFSYTFTGSRFTDSVGYPRRPVLFWTGTEVGVVWEYLSDGNTEIYFARADTSLTKIGGDIRVIGTPAQLFSVSGVWTGGGYGFTWTDYRSGYGDIYAAHFDPAGSDIGGGVLLAEHIGILSAYHSSIAWDGSQFGIAFGHSCDGDIYFAGLSAGGAEIGSEMTLVADSAASLARPNIVWNGTEYGLTWVSTFFGNQEIHFGRFTSMASPIGDTTVVATAPLSGGGAIPMLVWNGSSYALVWTAFTDGKEEIYFAGIDASGTEIDTERQLTITPDDSSNPAIAWNGNGYGLWWQENYATGRAECYFMRLKEDGSRAGSGFRATTCVQRDGLSLVWTGHEYLLAWSDVRDEGGYEIYLGRIGCGW